MHWSSGGSLSVRWFDLVRGGVGRGNVVEGLKSAWRKLRAGKPGRRFQDYHRSRKQDSGSSGGRALWLAAGVVLLVAGLVLLLIPGPGIPLVALGAGLIARESLLVARFVDALELWLRRVLSWAQRFWSSSPTWAKVLATVAAVLVVGALSAGAYELTVGF
jgi:hypothetical protein